MDTCTKWAHTNGLKWKPIKCSVVSTLPVESVQQLTLAENPLKVKKEARHLGISVMGGGFTKKAGSALETKCRAACAAITTQTYFDVSLPISTLRTLYQTNVRSILTYSAPLIVD